MISFLVFDEFARNLFLDLFLGNSFSFLDGTFFKTFRQKACAFKT